MATTNMSYDHPAYTAVYGLPTGQINGNAGASTKFAAFTSMLIKSVTLKPTTAGSSNDVFSFVQISGTTTTTANLGTFGSAATAFQNLVSTSAIVLAQGDTGYVQKGTDSTGTYVGMIEYKIQPFANVTQ